MKAVFLEQAGQEFGDAVQYYDSRERGLGQRFEDEIVRAIDWLTFHPEAYSLRRGVYRRMNLHIFPYYLPYVIRESTLWILAVAHSHQRPEYWIDRVRNLD